MPTVFISEELRDAVKVETSKRKIKIHDFVRCAVEVALLTLKKNGGKKTK